jgi:hypothetical protein
MFEEVAAAVDAMGDVIEIDSEVVDASESVSASVKRGVEEGEEAINILAR